MSPPLPPSAQPRSAQQMQSDVEVMHASPPPSLDTLALADTFQDPIFHPALLGPELHAVLLQWAGFIVRTVMWGGAANDAICNRLTPLRDKHFWTLHPDQCDGEVADHLRPFAQGVLHVLGLACIVSGVWAAAAALWAGVWQGYRCVARPRRRHHAHVELLRNAELSSEESSDEPVRRRRVSRRRRRYA
jgi:hypothetical protein